MRTIIEGMTAAMVLFVELTRALASTHYVDVNSTNPIPPYASWGTAAMVIQDAVEATADGDEIVVTNGTYATGGRVIYGLLTNRVAVTKPILLRSANGPSVTIIQGYQVPRTTNGDAAVRCVYLTNGACLVGFTLISGGTRDNSANADADKEQSGGGVWCEGTSTVLSNCVLTGNSAFSAGGGGYQGTLNNCDLSNNAATSGGGAFGAMLSNCLLISNSANSGGGGASCTLTRCSLNNNLGFTSGGGAHYSTLEQCTLTGNSAGYRGGGVNESTLNNCTLTGNLAAYDGGGASFSRLINCALVGNSASSFGGGASGGTLNNCTLTGNSASSGGGASGRGVGVNVPFSVALNNCILYFNSADNAMVANYGPLTDLNYCCTTPFPLGNNITADPRLTDAAHLSVGSPCHGAGSGDYISGTDIDGEPWASPPSIGCDEYHLGAAGPLQVLLNVDYTNVAAGFTVNFSAAILGHATSNRWDFGDGVSAASEIYRPTVSHVWGNPGNYFVRLTAYNETYPSGTSASLEVRVVTQAVHYVSLASGAPQPPYSSWATAATNIQDAVDVGNLPGALVLVTNGIYATGGRAVGGDGFTNRVAVDRPLTLRSVNGPQFTFIAGMQPETNVGGIRCVYLYKSASLSGFTLTNGCGYFGGGVCASGTAVVTNCVLVGNRADDSGGGAYGGTLASCVLSNNQAFNGGGAAFATLKSSTLASNIAQNGGGAAQTILDHCSLTGNFANLGGGAYGGEGAFGGSGVYVATLDTCTLIGNSASSGGGAYYCILTNCALSGNSATNGNGTGGGAFAGTLNNCTLTGNSAAVGGGAAGDPYGGSCALNNCIVYLNRAENIFPNYDDYTCVLSYSCTTPAPTYGLGNITNAPRFVDWASGNLRLQSNSPCINAGNNAYAPLGPDLGGNPRIAGGTVDIGAYEFQKPASVISYAWLQQYGLPTDGSADYLDLDGDGLNNWQEWRCGTNPTNPFSALRLISALPGTTNITVSWQSVAGVNYFLQRSTNLLGPGPVFTPVAAGISGQDGVTTYYDTNAADPGPFFYRVGVGD